MNIFDDWPPCYGLQDCIQGLLFLLHNPNLTDPLSPYFDGFFNKEEFARNVRKSLLGEEVEGVTFDSGEIPAAAETAKETERQEEDTLGLENIFADDETATKPEQQTDTLGQDQVFPKVVDVVDSISGRTVYHVQHPPKGEALDEGNGTVWIDDRVEKNTIDDSVCMNAVPFSSMIVHRPAEKGDRLISVCKHSCQTVVPVLTKLFKLLNVAAKYVRQSFMHVHRRAIDRTICYESIA